MTDRYCYWDVDFNSVCSIPLPRLKDRYLLLWGLAVRGRFHLLQRQPAADVHRDCAAKRREAKRDPAVAVKIAKKAPTRKRRDASCSRSLLLGSHNIALSVWWS
jgi:hypothetical protein